MEFDSSYSPPRRPTLRRFLSGNTSFASTGSSTVKSPEKGLSIKIPSQHQAPSVFNWSFFLIAVAFVGTILSGLFLAVAIRQPQYGSSIRTNGSFPPSRALLVTALLAKLIELKFVCVYIACIGRILTVRAKEGDGMSIAQLFMRNWILQPGMLFTHWKSVKYAGLSVLGVTTIIAAVASTLYTTASNALVAPQLRYGHAKDRTLFGQVSSSFGNLAYMERKCPNIISTSLDPGNPGETCVQIMNAANSYHMYQNWIADWITFNSSDFQNMQKRPTGTIGLNSNTTVESSWIDVTDTIALSNDHGRVITNVTLAIPHVGVHFASIDPINGVLQPQALGNQGEYSLNASVPSTALNVICAAVTEEDLAPLVYMSWSNANKSVDPTLWPSDDVPKWTSDEFLNQTNLDSIFEWGQEFNRTPPVFFKFPVAYNTLVNTSTITDVADTVYLLATNPQVSPQYMLCSMRAKLRSQCITNYQVNSGGSRLKALCNDEHTQFHPTYAETNTTAPTTEILKEWTGIGNLWTSAVAMDLGKTDANGSQARVMAELIPQGPQLRSDTPTMAESLAVLAGSTLTAVTKDGPFRHVWNYSTPALDAPQYQSFDVVIKSREYQSGPAGRADNGFFIILAIVFLFNLVCLGLLVYYRDQTTDFTETQNLFAVALSSAPNYTLANNGGEVHTTAEYRSTWAIKHTGMQYIICEAGSEPISAISEPISTTKNRRSWRPWLRNSKGPNDKDDYALMERQVYDPMPKRSFSVAKQSFDGSSRFGTFDGQQYPLTPTIVVEEAPPTPVGRPRAATLKRNPISLL